MNNSQTTGDNRPLVILHVAPTPFFSDRGCHIRIKGIIEALNKKNIRNILCTYHHGRNIENIETARIITIPGYDRVESGPTPFKYVADLFLFFKVLDLIKRVRPDLIHGHLHEGALIGWAASACFFWRKIPLIFDMQGSLVGELEAHGYFDKFKPLKKIFWFIEYLITRLPNAFVCSSEDSVQILKARFGVLPEKVRLASDGADVYDVTDDKIMELKAGLGMPEHKPIVIYTGALLEVKGLGSLCDFIHQSRKRQLDCHFLIVGYPEEQILEFVRANNFEKYCTITGRVPFENLSTYLACANLAIEPKLSESGEASGKLLNYMGASLPVLCFDSKNNREILGNSGYYAARNDADSLVDQLLIAIADLVEARQRGESARKRLLERYSWDRTAVEIVSMYEYCLQKKYYYDR